ncbi:30S ribosomal protein S4 [Candidatus Woesearchaeota archaeon]|jgi:small subunit ribosomal protein S4|nr:30S ribosomal protein S4 [Candidatus Woesearchaeota archaeon]MBT3537539.1 30S ribosomal protein S4 [Candidatus Woesearchaeota archaeon]MBT4696843.1 30S ribosomal protein S4 [Candidatus Woesearchaeota archaeon]MBT4717273.1 30S ribosomal protein S4 [Candidatus Woesearchaeota archaeon]MBT7106151.1 30S ribosomal protein S4 [Candidatus Woesearchaeota archaeon]
MGDPRKFRKQYSGPSHPWNKDRLEEESGLVKEFGLKNKTEVYRSRSLLSRFKNTAKKLIASNTGQADVEREQLMSRLQSLGIINAGAQTDDVLSLELKDLMERRLQTRLLRQNLARSVKQARQMITHGHITVSGKTITSPSYLVTVSEDVALGFANNSNFVDPEHPERLTDEKKEEVKDEKRAKATEKREEKKAAEKKEAPKVKKAEKKEEVKEETKKEPEAKAEEKK